MKRLTLISVLLLIYSAEASAYVGPGLGAGALAAIVGVFMSILMAIIGVFWYPLKRLFKKEKKEEMLSDTSTEPHNEKKTGINADQEIEK